MHFEKYLFRYSCMYLSQSISNYFALLIKIYIYNKTSLYFTYIIFRSKILILIRTFPSSIVLELLFAVEMIFPPLIIQWILIFNIHIHVIILMTHTRPEIFKQSRQNTRITKTREIKWVNFMEFVLDFFHFLKGKHSKKFMKLI